MQIYRGIEQLPALQSAVATVGSYDGVHAGHRHLLQLTCDEAKRQGSESVVFTFDPHPRLALDPQCGMRLLTSLEEKCQLIEEIGIDHLVILHFDHAFSQISPEAFIRLLMDRAHVTCLIIGYDHRFGCNKSGSFSLLKEVKGLKVIEVAEQEIGNEHLSSTVVRRLIEAGEVSHAARLLGHAYRVEAKRTGASQWQPCDPHKLLPKADTYRVCDTEEKEYRLTIASDGTWQITPSPTDSHMIFTFI